MTRKQRDAARRRHEARIRLKAQGLLVLAKVLGARDPVIINETEYYVRHGPHNVASYNAFVKWMHSRAAHARVAPGAGAVIRQSPMLMRGNARGVYGYMP